MKSSKLLAVLLAVCFVSASYAENAKTEDDSVKTTGVTEKETPVVENGEKMGSLMVSPVTILSGGGLKDVATLSLDFGFTTHNVTRGIVTEDQGLIFQTAATLDIKVADRVSVYFGTAMSFQDNNTGAAPGSSMPAWAEADVFVGVNVNVYENLSVGLEYKAYTYPNNSGGDVQEINLLLAYDDAGKWGDATILARGLQPHMLFGFEVSGSQAQDGNTGVYMEVGIRPSWSIFEDKVLLALPVTIGLSLDDYYGSSSNGYAYTSVGGEVVVPLKCLGSKFGNWKFKAGVEFLFLGNIKALNVGGDDFEVVGKAGFSVDF